MIEEFRDIPNYEGIYQVSNLGRVKSLARKNSIGRRVNEKIMKLSIASDGYLNTGLRKDNKSKSRRVHQLVAESFLGHVPCGYKIIVDHIDENPLNNRLDNLQLWSHRNNIAKGYKSKGGTSEYTGVYWDKDVNKWRANITINGKNKYLGRFTCELKAAKAYQDALKAL